jgi:hypothetical protein
LGYDDNTQAEAEDAVLLPLNLNRPSRRRLLKGAAGTGAALIAAPYLLRHATAQAWRAGDPFSLGVAAGAPRPDGFVLWTRLAPDPLSNNPAMPGGMHGADVTIGYEIATDSSLRNIVRRGETAAEESFAYSVHLDVSGLDAGRPYWYRFTSGDASSRIGRALTLPKPNSALDRLKFGFVSCSNYEHGYFPRTVISLRKIRISFCFLATTFTNISKSAARQSAGTRTASKRRRYRLTAIATRNISSIPICSRCMHKRPRWSPGTTTRCRMTMPTSGRSSSTIRRSF